MYLIKCTDITFNSETDKHVVITYSVMKSSLFLSLFEGTLKATLFIGDSTLRRPKIFYQSQMIITVEKQKSQMKLRLCTNTSSDEMNKILEDEDEDDEMKMNNNSRKMTENGNLLKCFYKILFCKIFTTFLNEYINFVRHIFSNLIIIYLFSFIK